MINQRTPDFTNTPASAHRPRFLYAAAASNEPLVSVITPCGQSAAHLRETALAVQRMSVPYWEWLICDDGSGADESLRQVAEVVAREPRARVIRQERRDLDTAWQRATGEARAQYLLHLDAGDLIEPTFVEKALWLLATQPQFAACDSYAITFGAQNLLWGSGGDEGARDDDLRANFPLVVRRDAWEHVSGQDERRADERRANERVSATLRLCLSEAGMWTHTLPEYLSWHRECAASTYRAGETARPLSHGLHLRSRAHNRPVMSDALARREPSLETTPPFINPLPKSAGMKRLLLVAPWLAMGGADKFNLDLIAQLAARDYETTVVTTAWSDDAWGDRFAALTPDIFRLHRFLTWAEYPRFLDYLIASREIDALLLSSSELGYALLPYLRSRHPNVPILDFNHMVEETWRDGGYPALSVAAATLLDRRLTCSEHLRAWEVARGAPAETTHTVYCGTDTRLWNPATEDTAGVRARLGFARETPLILFAGRMVEQKRPQLAGEILLALARRDVDFVAVVAGDGPELTPLTRMLARGGLTDRVRCVGAQPEEEMRALTATADIALLPSAREGIALVLYEAMAMQTTPVAAAVGGQGELITPDCGYLIEQGPDEVERYVAALTELLSDPERRRVMGEACRARVVARFDLAVMGAAMDTEITAAIACGAGVVALDRADADRRALIAVQQARRWELPQAEWANRGGFRWLALARQTREKLVPIGSQRYLSYQRLRQRFSKVAVPKRAQSR